MGIFSTLIGAAFNADQNNEARRFNRDEAEKNRQFQEAMMDKSYNQSVDFWNMQNEYNSPANQVARMKEAGINPALSGAITPGMASGGTSTSASGSQASTSPVTIAASGITDSILRMVNNNKQMNLVDAQANKLNSDATLDKIAAQTKLTESLAHIDNIRDSSAKYKAETATIDAMRDISVQGAYQNLMNLQAQYEESVLRQVSQFQYIQAFPEQKRLEFAEKVANIALTYSNRDLSSEQAATEASKRLLNYAQANGLSISNEIAYNTMGYAIEEAKMKLKRSAQPQNLTQLGNDIGEKLGDLRDKYLEKIDKYIFKPSKKLWKDTKRAFGL